MEKELKIKDKFITDFKTKIINKFTGGKIGTHVFKEPIFPDSDEIPKLENSFLSRSGEYIGDYKHAWWYVKNNLVVCDDYPHGVAYVLHKPAKECKGIEEMLEKGELNTDYIKGCYGYSHRGGATFCIGDKIFDPNHVPRKEDFTTKELKELKLQQIQTIKECLEDGWYKTREEAEKNCPVTYFVTFNKRGKKTIKTLDDAIQAAKNLSNYLG